MAIQKAFILRYRSIGHVRFQVPEQICDATISRRIEVDLLALEGVKRVRIFVGQRKLSIRFDENVTPFNALAQQLFQLLEILEKDLSKERPALVVKESDKKWRQQFKQKLNDLPVNQWFKEKYTDAKETVQAAKIVTKIGMKRPKAFIRDPEAAIINFLNDILVLYLIKIHWKRISQVWLLNPLKYRYEWLAIVYLFFLLMRSRRPKR